ncbi:MAG: hypothetical protein IAX21_00405 [Candidatus Bathyarchaeota archaeon]|nr:MAG: hypothetical protein IAX21_00405 [Candidatus Bathyarchaeota archaeon]
MSIAEIKVVGVDEIRTHAIGQKNSMLKVYFELSRPPTTEWKTFFEKRNIGTMEVDGRHIVVEALSSEIPEKLVEAQMEVAKTNQKFLEHV